MKLQKRFLAAALGFFLASAVFSASAEAAPRQSSGENSAFSAVQTVKKSRPAPSRAGTYRPYKGGENAEPARKGLPPRFSEPEKEKAQWTPERRRQMRDRAGGTYRSPEKENDNDPTIGIIPSQEKQQSRKTPKKGNEALSPGNHLSSAKAPEINTPSRQRPVNPYQAWQEQHKKDDGRFDKDFRHERRDHTYRVNDPYDTDHTPRIRDEKDRHPRPLPTAKKKNGKTTPFPGTVRNHNPAGN